MFRFLAVFILTSIAFAETNSSVVTSVNFLDPEVPSRRDARVLEQPLLEAPVDSNYQIAPGDYFELFFENRSMILPVSPEGYITVEGAGQINLTKVPLGEAKRKILELASKRFNAKNTFVQLGQIKRFRVYVYGSVPLQGHHVIDDQSKLTLALRYAGGWTSEADLSNVLLIRNKKDTLRFDLTLDDLVHTIKNDPYLQPGDVIWVPFKKKENLVKIVSPDLVTSFPITGSTTLDSILIRIGYYSRNVATPATVLITQRDGSTKHYQYEECAFKPLQAGSVVELMGKREFVYVGGITLQPGRTPFVPGYTAMDYLAASGLTIQSADFRQITVRHNNGVVEEVDPYNGGIKPGDYIEIPRSFYEQTKDFTQFLASVLSVIAVAVSITIYLKSE